MVCGIILKYQVRLNFLSLFALWLFPAEVSPLYSPQGAVKNIIEEDSVDVGRNYLVYDDLTGQVGQF